MPANNLGLTFAFVDEAKQTVPVNVDELRELAAFVIDAEGSGGAWEVTVALVNGARLQGLHREFMDDDTPTDIMTFPLGDDEGARRGGELVISADHVRAGAWGLGPADELRYLVIHGLLHLLGWRDASVTERDAMLARQDDLLYQWKQRFQLDVS